MKTILSFFAISLFSLSAISQQQSFFLSKSSGNIFIAQQKTFSKSHSFAKTNFYHSEIIFLKDTSLNNFKPFSWENFGEQCLIGMGGGITGGVVGGVGGYVFAGFLLRNSSGGGEGWGNGIATLFCITTGVISGNIIGTAAGIYFANKMLDYPNNLSLICGRTIGVALISYSFFLAGALILSVGGVPLLPEAFLTALTLGSLTTPIASILILNHKTIPELLKKNKFTNSLRITPTPNGIGMCYIF